MPYLELVIKFPIDWHLNLENLIFERFSNIWFTSNDVLKYIPICKLSLKVLKFKATFFSAQ